MTHYLLALIKVNDDSWIPNYIANVLEIVTRHGGRYLSRSSNIRTLEGNPPETDLVAILAFPTEEALQAFVSDPDYAPLASARRSGSNSHFLAIDSSDTASVIPYLPADGSAASTATV